MTDTKTTAAGWKKAAVHEVIAPSGTTISLKIPDLPRMIESGQIPQHLLDATLGVAAVGDGEDSKTPTKEQIVQEREFTDCMVLFSVVEPKITEADLADIPYEDKEFIVMIATRRRDLDAVGNHIAGLHALEPFRRFRQIGEFSPDVAGV